MRKTDAFRRAAALMAALSITVSLAAPAFAGTYYIDYGDIIITKKDDGSQEIKQNGTIIENDDRGEIIITTVAAATTTQESDLEGPAAEDSGFGPVVEDNYQPAPRPSRRMLRSRRTPTSRRMLRNRKAQTGRRAQTSRRVQTSRRTLTGRRTLRSRRTLRNRKMQTSRRALRNRKMPTSRRAPRNRKSADRPENAEESEDTDRQKSAEEQESAGQQPQPQQAAPTSVNGKGNGVFGNTITVINIFTDTVLNLTLKNVKIDVSDADGKAALSVQGDGNVTIELDGNNEPEKRQSQGRS